MWSLLISPFASHLQSSIFHFPKCGENTSEVVLSPGGSIGAWFTGLSGIIVTLFAMIIATIPPPDLGGSALVFRVKVIGGALGFVLIGGLIYWRALWEKGGSNDVRDTVSL